MLHDNFSVKPNKGKWILHHCELEGETKRKIFVITLYFGIANRLPGTCFRRVHVQPLGTINFRYSFKASLEIILWNKVACYYYHGGQFQVIVTSSRITCTCIPFLNMEDILFPIVFIFWHICLMCRRRLKIECLHAIWVWFFQGAATSSISFRREKVPNKLCNGGSWTHSFNLLIVTFGICKIW